MKSSHQEKTSIIKTGNSTSFDRNWIGINPKFYVAFYFALSADAYYGSSDKSNSEKGYGEKRIMISYRYQN